MQSAADLVPYQTKMVACLLASGQSSELTKEFAKLKHAHGNMEVDIANFNSSSQVVISGNALHIDQIVIPAIKCTKLVRKTLNLSVGAPFHSQFMDPALPIYRDHVMRSRTMFSDVNERYGKVISNVSAVPHFNAETCQLSMVKHIRAPTRWAQSIRYCRLQGVRKWLCIGPGRALGTMLKHDYPEDSVTYFDTSTELPEFGST